ncbi:MAG: DUF4168 domain-containing protein [Spirochaetaceae bacterium]|nr:MAG: DUF4168 domain-containing protein [Spirochaetaceae bacterium]
MKKLLIAMCAIALTAGMGFAQDMFPGEAPAQIEVGDTELMQFVDALREVEKVQVATQQDMLAVLDDQGISTERFNELYQAEHSPEFELDQPLSAEEENRYRVAEQELQAIQQEAQVQMSQAVEDEGIGVERFNEIYVALTQDPELQQRVQQLIN